MREWFRKNKLIGGLLFWSILCGAHLTCSMVSARMHFEQYAGYGLFAPEWKPRYAEIGPGGWFWTMYVPQFNLSNIGYGEETFLVTPAEQARLIAFCKRSNIPVRTGADNAPYTEAALALAPALLALWLWSRRRERKFTVKQLGCGTSHAQQIEQQAIPQIQLEEKSDKERDVDESKVKAMKNVHVFNLNSHRKDFIRRL
jgi:hypothetical protein